MKNRCRPSERPAYKHYYYNANGENTSIVEHDSGDNVIKTTTLTYDDFGRMLTWTDGDNSTSYSYRGAGWQRASETIGGTTTKFLYDNNDIVGDLVSGSFTRQYVTPFLDDNLSMTVIGGEQAGTYYYHKDPSGVRGLTNSSQVVVNVNAYGAFGEPYAPGTTTGLAQRYTFQGREAGLAGAPMYFRNRSYDTSLGRFNRRDPLLGGDPLYNPYAAMGNNPLTYIDPEGLGEPTGAGASNLIPHSEPGTTPGFRPGHEPQPSPTTPSGQPGGAPSKPGSTQPGTFVKPPPPQLGRADRGAPVVPTAIPIKGGRAGVVVAVGYGVTIAVGLVQRWAGDDTDANYEKEVNKLAEKCYRVFAFRRLEPGRYPSSEWGVSPPGQSDVNLYYTIGVKMTAVKEQAGMQVETINWYKQLLSRDEERLREAEREKSREDAREDNFWHPYVNGRVDDAKKIIETHKASLAQQEERLGTYNQWLRDYKKFYCCGGNQGSYGSWSGEFKAASCPTIMGAPVGGGKLVELKLPPSSP